MKKADKNTGPINHNSDIIVKNVANFGDASPYKSELKIQYTAHTPAGPVLIQRYGPLTDKG